ncbi:DDE-type integrase/transposase/recombinase [Actinoplanes teichomyceticus]|uniref:Integrase-like protein n=1 Tax=Actinoplanes teichomyceticus TaxID=1867 RepID=A0A561VGH1_ACTTI|nr:DDE-type integrase/transposase/recombinase [Actinoplanes teichomyceticus]TWG10701.1 integrase-like protein [Actinoplanes teichomyceticus]GIF15469.1 hypothetical protein Ate01nite_55010 [Actinoplanes teichomyceticus]
MVLTPNRRIQLKPGAVVVLGGQKWTVKEVAPHRSELSLTSPNRQGIKMTLSELIYHPDLQQPADAASTNAFSERLSPNPDLTEIQRDRAMLREEHLQEVHCGFRSGDPLLPAEGEPKPCYDPDRTTLTERRRAKIIELNNLRSLEKKLLGIRGASYRTLQRWESKRGSDGYVGCADGRWTRRRTGHRPLTERAHAAIHQVYQETFERSDISMKTHVVLVQQLMREKYGPESLDEVPKYATFRLIWFEWFGKSRTRRRYVNEPLPRVRHNFLVVHRPGQVVALDTTIVPVKVRESVFGEVVSVHLTLALDLYTHSIVAFRLTLLSDSALDVAMVLRDMTMPLPMRPGWSSALAWPYPGIPKDLVADFAGYSVAGLPFLHPETVTTDHGSVYRNYHVREVLRVLRSSIRPSRLLRPTDKQAVERAFGAIRSLLFEKLISYTGVDVADRGPDPEGGAVLYIEELEHLIATWVVGYWQNRKLDGAGPAWDPTGDHSPNTLFAAAMEQDGFAMEIPRPELYYEVLRQHYLANQPNRGVHVGGLWYYGAILAGKPKYSPRGGKHKGWRVARDPRDVRHVYFHDDTTDTWHSLAWVGIPEGAELPAFSDTTVKAALAKARDAGLRPRSDKDLLPFLLDLLDEYSRIDDWYTTKTKKDRVARAREVLSAETAQADRPAQVDQRLTSDQPRIPEQKKPTRRTARERRQEEQNAIDKAQAKRREKALSGRPEPAAPLQLGSGSSGFYDLPPKAKKAPKINEE